MDYNLNSFDEHYVYKGYALVNEIYEDEDHRSNTWSWGKVENDCIVDQKILTGVSSNSYGPFEEIFEVFKITVDKLASV
jgi:hypothetical protein